jgi:hypothetical protein
VSSKLALHYFFGACCSSTALSSELVPHIPSMRVDWKYRNHRSLLLIKFTNITRFLTSHGQIAPFASTLGFRIGLAPHRSISNNFHSTRSDIPSSALLLATLSHTTGRRAAAAVETLVFHIAVGPRLTNYGFLGLLRFGHGFSYSVVLKHSFL